MKHQVTRIGSGARALAAALVLAAGAAALQAQVCGDLNDDGEVNVIDYALCEQDFGCTGGNCTGDVDGDGDTDQQDVAWVVTFLSCGSTPNPPCGPCEAVGGGSMNVELAQVDNSYVGPGFDQMEPEFNGGVTHFTFDIVITLTADNYWTPNYWTTQYSYVELLQPQVEFFNHVGGNDVEPSQALIDVFGALEFDSFYAAPPALFDDNPGFLGTAHWSNTSAEALWWKQSRDTDYIATTQRFTLIVPEGAMPAVLADDCRFEVLAGVKTEVTASFTGSDLHHYEFTIVDLNQPICPGDIDGDGHVGQADLGILLSTYNLPSDDPQYDNNADLDCDGDVDQSDLGILLAHYGEDC